MLSQCHRHSYFIQAQSKKSINPPPTHINKKISTIQPPLPNNPPPKLSLSPMKTHIKTHPPLWGLWQIKHYLRWQGKREVEKIYGKEIWCAMERKSKSSMPWKGFLKIEAHGEEIGAREDREKLDIGHNLFPIWMKFFPLLYLLTS